MRLLPSAVMAVLLLGVSAAAQTTARLEASLKALDASPAPALEGLLAECGALRGKTAPSAEAARAALEESARRARKDATAESLSEVRARGEALLSALGGGRAPVAAPAGESPSARRREERARRDQAAASARADALLTDAFRPKPDAGAAAYAPSGAMPSASAPPPALVIPPAVGSGLDRRPVPIPAAPPASPRFATELFSPKHYIPAPAPAAKAAAWSALARVAAPHPPGMPAALFTGLPDVSALGAQILMTNALESRPAMRSTDPLRPIRNPRLPMVHGSLPAQVALEGDERVTTVTVRKEFAGARLSVALDNKQMRRYSVDLPVTQDLKFSYAHTDLGAGIPGSDSLGVSGSLGGDVDWRLGANLSRYGSRLSGGIGGPVVWEKVLGVVR